MELLSSNLMRIFHFNSLTCKCVALLAIALVLRSILLSGFSSGIVSQDEIVMINDHSSLRTFEAKKIKFLEVPQIVWGLNNQKIAFARACLTARMMNRTLLMPSLSASLFYKEIDKLQPIEFEKVFQFEEFNSRCEGFVRLGRYSDISNKTDVVELQKGSGRKWTVERDLDQLRQFSRSPNEGHEIIRIIGKNPFLWHDHWPIEDYAKVFECLVLVDEISEEAARVVSKIREIGIGLRGIRNPDQAPYVAVHMRIEKDWMIHCKKMEQRSNISEICSSKSEIMERVGNIQGLKTPLVIYLAVADSLLGDEGRELSKTGERRKPRFLCLHGFRTSGEIFKKQVSKWPEFVLDKLDLVFLDGPFPGRGKSDVEGLFDPPYYEWFQFNKEFTEYENFEECLEYIEESIVKHGPIDGLLGFSQGAVLSAALPGLQAKGVALTKVPKIKYLVIVGGAKLRDPAIAQQAYASTIKCPSVHFLGEYDFLKPHGIELLDSFVDPFVINHPKGHTIPRLDEKSIPIMMSFLEKIKEDATVEKEEKCLEQEIHI